MRQSQTVKEVAVKCGKSEEYTRVRKAILEPKLPESVITGGDFLCNVNLDNDVKISCNWW